MDSKTILFVGGGSLGHVMPGVAVCDAMQKVSPDITPVFLCAPREEETAYLASKGLRHATINAGKFPRGLSVRWITFPVLFVLSFIQSLRIVKREHPAAVFSKGGFVSVPVCLAARLKGVPVVLHESDSVMGMANGMIAKIAAKVCVGFPPDEKSSKSEVRNPKIVFTGNPVRPEVLTGSRDEGLRITGFSGTRPVIMVTGGSQGAAALNQAVVTQIDALLAVGDVIHLTGKGKTGADARAGYWKAESVFAELPHLYAAADVVVTRGGAGAVSELAALSKAAIVVPLRGLAGDHQWKNSTLLADAGAAMLLPQEELTGLGMAVRSLVDNKTAQKTLGERLHGFFPQDAASKIAHAVLDVAEPRG